MTARRQSRRIETALDLGALAAEVARLGAVADGLATRQIETQEDLRELRALMRATGKAPPEGMIALKEAVALTGANYETARRWCARDIVHAQRGSLRWYVSLPSLTAELARRRKSAA